LKRAGHWFSTTLVESRSWEVLVGLNWQDDNTLDPWLDFGCEAEMSKPVTAVGPIRIVYYWGDPGHVPKVGYESRLHAVRNWLGTPNAPRRAVGGG
jgi:hypothetical protein